MGVFRIIIFLTLSLGIVGSLVEPTYAQEERQIASVLEQRLARSQADALKVRFSVQGNEVTLWGEAPSERARQELVQLAEQTPGVGIVRSDIKIVPKMGGSQPIVSDEELRARIVDSLQDAGVPASDLQISVRDGGVDLAGSRNSFREVDKILSIVLNTQGVKDVRSEIEVRGQEYSALDFETR